MENDNDVLVDGVETEESSSSEPQEESPGDGLPDESETVGSSAEAGGDQLEEEDQLQEEDRLEEEDQLQEEDRLQGEDGSLLEEEGESQEALADYITAEELKEIVYGSIEEYFSKEVVTVSVQEKGIDVPLEDLGLRDVLLFVLVLAALGHAISEIIGGKLKWRK